MSRHRIALAAVAVAPLVLSACTAGLAPAPRAPLDFSRHASAPGWGAEEARASVEFDGQFAPPPAAARPKRPASAPAQPTARGDGPGYGYGGGGRAASSPAPAAPSVSGWPAPVAEAAPPAKSAEAPPGDEGWRVESEGAQLEDAAAQRRAELRAEPRRDRPGLGTEWGETRWAPIREVPFERATGQPFSVATLFYNDRTGVEAMASYDVRNGGRLTAPVTVRPGITVSIVDEEGSPLDAVALDGRVYVVGEAGHRYSVVVSNSTAHRVEVVLSVDGLDAVDGKAASVGKRGYLLAPWDTLTVDGFRRNLREVAAFRFGSLRDSYAGRTGSDRNVGVVGVALFAERGALWDDEEIERRRTAQPFSDSRFAQPPTDWN